MNQTILTAIKRFQFPVGVIIGFILGAHTIFAGLIPDPPLIKDKQTLLYLRRIASNWNNIPIVTVNPNGSRTGRVGDIVLLFTGGNYYLEINTNTGPSGGTTWVGEQLTTVP